MARHPHSFPPAPVWMPLLLASALLLSALPTHADDRQKREREALRRLQQQVQLYQSQVGTLEQEKTRLATDLAQADKDAKAARSKAGRLARTARALRAEKEAQARELEQLRQTLATTQTQLKDTQTNLEQTRSTLEQTRQTLSGTEADKRRLEGVKARQEKEIALCEEKNGQLYSLGRELMVRFEQKSCNEILAQKEPFTGLKRVQVENLLEEYRDKLDEQKLLKPPAP